MLGLALTGILGVKVQVFVLAHQASHHLLESFQLRFLLGTKSSPIFFNYVDSWFLYSSVLNSGYLPDRGNVPSGFRILHVKIPKYPGTW